MNDQERKERLEFLSKFIQWDNPRLDLIASFGVEKLEDLSDNKIIFLTDQYGYGESSKGR
jgi:hypothetical protein